MPRLMVLGNCVAERLMLLLEGLLQEQDRCLPDLNKKWEVVKTPPIHLLRDAQEQAEVAGKAAKCDLVMTQPLFNYGACNTGELKPRLGQRLVTISAPNFLAYFPDCLDIRPYKSPEKYSPPLEWHSKIMVQCRAANVPVEEVENIYLHHPVFSEKKLLPAIERSWQIYERRDSGVDIPTVNLAREWYDREPLFFTWNHPGDRLLKHMLSEILVRLDLGERAIARAVTHIPWQEGSDPHAWTRWGFGFNAWPIINRQHRLFAFPERSWFRVAGKEIDIMTAAIMWYGYYNDHPEILEQAVQAAL